MNTTMNAAGFKLPVERAVTENEMDWIRLIRVITEDRDPAPCLHMAQALSRAWQRGAC